MHTVQLEARKVGLRPLISAHERVPQRDTVSDEEEAVAEGLPGTAVRRHEFRGSVRTSQAGLARTDVWAVLHLCRVAKRWELNTVLIVNNNNRTTVGLANNTGQQ